MHMCLYVVYAYKLRREAKRGVRAPEGSFTWGFYLLDMGSGTPAEGICTNNTHYLLSLQLLLFLLIEKLPFTYVDVSK